MKALKVAEQHWRDSIGGPTDERLRRFLHYEQAREAFRNAVNGNLRPAGVQKPLRAASDAGEQ